MEGEEEKKGEEEEEEEGRRTWAAGFGVSGGPGFLVMLVKEGWRPAPGRGRRDLGGVYTERLKRDSSKAVLVHPCALRPTVFLEPQIHIIHTQTSLLLTCRLKRLLYLA